MLMKRRSIMRKLRELGMGGKTLLYDLMDREIQDRPSWSVIGDISPEIRASIGTGSEDLDERRAAKPAGGDKSAARSHT
jgi:hypothetical protein